jgi:predicted ATP-binding protein involved in virulence
MNNAVADVRVKSVHIKKLFGIYDHDVVLHGDERITVVHGPNGVGKTVLFKLMRDFLAGSGTELLKYPFAEFRIEFTNEVSFIAKKNDSKKRNSLEVSSIPSVQNTATVKIDSKSFEKLAEQLARRLRIHRVGTDEWFDMESEEKLSAYDVFSRYGDDLDDEFDLGQKNSLHIWRKAQAFIPHVHLIEAQRLIKISKKSHRTFRGDETLAIRDTVMEYSQQLKKRIDTTLSDYGKLAQKLDHTFALRMLEQTEPARNADSISKALQSLEEKQEKYQKLGLIEEQNVSIPNLLRLVGSKGEGALGSMTVYVTDMEEKLEVLDELAQRVSLLLNQINGKFINKELYINVQHELAVRTGQGDVIPVSALSSGEQHQIVLAYDLLFRIEPNSLVMIDEPELSLHVNWQERFLSDLGDIINVSNFDALIATHSPYIINGRNELLVALSAQERSESE